jgi:transcriptional regulator with XRE-family HTH domain
MSAAIRRRRRVAREDGPDPIDVYVGERMKNRRVQVGFSQPALAELIGVSFQAVQKYEAAGMRIAASTLHRLCQVLGVPATYFFAGYGAPIPAKRRRGRKARRNLKVQASQAPPAKPAARVAPSG